MANIQDVARHAGVSISTVSRVLNDRGRVNAEVVANVQAAIQALHYTPNRAARSLRTQQSRIIGLLISDIQNPFFTVLVRGIEDVVQQNGYSLILCNSDENEQKERQYIEVLCAEHVAGAIIVPTHENQRSMRIFDDQHIPVVAVDRRVPNVDTVLVDNKRGAYEAVSHLITNGYQRIGIITGPHNTTTGRERLEGYYKALEEAGIAIDPAIVRSGSFKMDSGRALANELLDVEPGIDALFITNNLMTLGALQALHDRNLQVPNDIGIVSFDEMPWATLGSISLTTVTQPVYEIGSTAAMRLFQRLQNPQAFTNQEIVLAATLCVRNSSTARLLRL
jgi:DNA-binding LacI/PurR family transcriptional regulator